MSITDRIGWRRVCVSRAHALTASHALVAQARRESEWLAADLAEQEDHAEPGAMQSEDSENAARRLNQTLAALDAIGWPHQFASAEPERKSRAS